jgi:hypothetical protein
MNENNQEDCDLVATRDSRCDPERNTRVPLNLLWTCVLAVVGAIVGMFFGLRIIACVCRSESVYGGAMFGLLFGVPFGGLSGGVLGAVAGSAMDLRKNSKWLRLKLTDVVILAVTAAVLVLFWLAIERIDPR